MMTKQSTIKNDVPVQGVNVFNGKKNHVIFHPADPSTGLVFLVNKEYIPAILDNAYRTRFFGFGSFISLEGHGENAHEVEHVLSPVYALGIDNLVIELSDGVCPTVENGAEEFFQALKEAKQQEQPLEKKFWVYNKASKTYKNPTTSISGERDKKRDRIAVMPAKVFLISYYAYYPHKVIGPKVHRFEVNEESYQEGIMKARSPAFIPSGLKKGLFLFLERNGYIGINERNYLWVMSKDSEQYGNPEEYGVRYKGKEFVRHKCLDVLGTLALTGRHFKATEFNFYMTGHEFDLYALKRLFQMKVFSTYGRI